MRFAPSPRRLPLGIDSRWPRSIGLARVVMATLTAIVAACASNPAQTAEQALAPKADAEQRQRSDDVYRVGQVTKPVSVARGNMPPQYPEILKTAGIGGFVLLSFVVDTAGLVDVGSAKVETMSDDRFLGTVVAALPAQRFTPAEVAGRKVKQLVAVPYYFGFVDTTMAHGAQSIEQAMKTLGGLPLAPIKR